MTDPVALAPAYHRSMLICAGLLRDRRHDRVPDHPLVIRGHPSGQPAAGHTRHNSGAAPLRDHRTTPAARPSHTLTGSARDRPDELEWQRHLRRAPGPPTAVGRAAAGDRRRCGARTCLGHRPLVQPDRRQQRRPGVDARPAPLIEVAPDRSQVTVPAVCAMPRWQPLCRPTGSLSTTLGRSPTSLSRVLARQGRTDPAQATATSRRPCPGSTLMRPNGELARLDRTDADFGGSVVALGCVGSRHACDARRRTEL